MGPIDISEPGKDYFDMYVDSLLGINDMPLTLEEELHPTEWLRAKKTKFLRNSFFGSDTLCEKRYFS